MFSRVGTWVSPSKDTENSFPIRDREKVKFWLLGVIHLNVLFKHSKKPQRKLNGKESGHKPWFPRGITGNWALKQKSKAGKHGLVSTHTHCRLKLRLIQGRGHIGDSSSAFRSVESVFYPMLEMSFWQKANRYIHIKCGNLGTFLVY